MAADAPALQATVARIREQIRHIRSEQQSVGEQDTKAVLIEPLLAGLGWGVTDLNEVRREYKSKPQDNPVDYALFISGAARLFIEAKSLGAALSDRKWLSQIISYAAVAGVEWCVLTDGDSYQIYNSHAPVDVGEKLFRTLQISDVGQELYAVETLALLSRPRIAEDDIGALWRACFVDRQVKAAVETLIRERGESLVRLIRARTRGLSPADVRASLDRAAVTVAYPVHERRLETEPLSPEPILGQVGSGEAPPPPPGDRISFRLTKSSIEYRLLYVRKRFRERFPGYEELFTIETEIGTDQAKVTSAPDDTPVGHPTAGTYIKGDGLTKWFERHPELAQGDLVALDVVERHRRYKIAINGRGGGRQ